MRNVNHVRSGVSLIEMIIAILVLGITAMGVMSLFIESSRQSVRSEVVTVAAGLAEGVMEDILRSSFANVSGQTQIAFPDPFSAYAYSVTIDYVDGSDLTTVVANSEYKKITVTVSHDLVNDIVLETVISDYNNEE